MNTRVQIGSPDYGLSFEYFQTYNILLPNSLGWDTVLTYKRDGDGVNFTFEPKSNFKINCSDLPDEWDVLEEGNPWASLVDMDAGCWVFQVVIEGFCNDTWDIVWFGEFTSAEWKINLDRKFVEVQPKQNSTLECLKRNWTEVKNIFDLPDEITVEPYLKNYEVTEYSDVYTDPCISITPPGVPDFCFDEVIETTNTPLDHFCTFLYHRSIKEGTCSGGLPEPPDLVNDWFLLEDNCPDPPLYWRCPESRLPFVYPAGRKLADVLEYLVSEVSCGLSIISDFLNINPDDTHPTNSAYDASELYLQNLILFQKSDIKRFDASEHSLKPSWTIKLKDLLDDLTLLFKLGVKVDGVNGILRIEHISYFEATAGNDYTNEYYIKELQRDNSDTPRLTRFQFRDEQCSDYFKGFPIEIYCGEGEKEVRLTQISTDLNFVKDADNAESIGDAGWFLMSTFLDVGVYRNIDENRPLSWTELHSNYHTYEMASIGKINDQEVIPDSLMKTRKQPPFTVTHCCTDTFDPSNYITTALGQGKIDNADWNLTKNILTLSTKY